MVPPHEYRVPPAVQRASAARLQRLRQTLSALNCGNCLLVSCEKDIQYLTGFVGHDSLMLVTDEHAWVISDPRYDEFLNPWREAKVAEIIMGTRHRLFETVRELCEKHSIRKMGVQADHLTIAARAKLASIIGEERIVHTQDVLFKLRMKKDELEIAAIEKAIGIQQEALTAALDQIEIGMSELQFSAVLEYEMKSRGAFGAGFSPIIGAGPNSSIIHHMSGARAVETGVLLVDWGAAVDGYNGDLTRTFGIGEMAGNIREIYAIVLEAQMAAIAAIAPGKICADIDAIARRIITKAGYGDQFGHGLGHGLGMDVHEGPYFNNLQTDMKLEPGMVMTVEPGIYLPGVGGVRIEDDVLVTPTGARVLSNWPKDIDSMIIEPAMSRVE